MVLGEKKGRQNWSHKKNTCHIIGNIIDLVYMYNVNSRSVSSINKWHIILVLNYSAFTFSTNIPTLFCNTVAKAYYQP